MWGKFFSHKVGLIGVKSKVMKNKGKNNNSGFLVEEGKLDKFWKALAFSHQNIISLNWGEQ